MVGRVPQLALVRFAYAANSQALNSKICAKRMESQRLPEATVMSRLKRGNRDQRTLSWFIKDSSLYYRPPDELRQRIRSSLREQLAADASAPEPDATSPCHKEPELPPRSPCTIVPQTLLVQ